VLKTESDTLSASVRFMIWHEVSLPNALIMRHASLFGTTMSGSALSGGGLAVKAVVWRDRADSISKAAAAIVRSPCAAAKDSAVVEAAASKAV